MYSAALLLFSNLLLTAAPAITPQPSDSQRVIMTSPVDGDTLWVGDTITVKWVTVEDIISVDIFVSPNGGKNWLMLNGASIPYYNTALWSNFKWCIPEKITINSKEYSLIDNSSVLFEVENYSTKISSEKSANVLPLVTKKRSEAVTPDWNNRKKFPKQQAALLNKGNLAVLRFDCNGRVIGSLQQASSGLIFELINDRSDQSSTLQKTESIQLK